MGRKVLVTGASGFIGWKMGLYFKQQGYDVLGWDRSPSDKDYSIISIDMRNVHEVQDRLKEFSPDIIIHCAGSADVGKSVQNPELDFEGNVTLTHHLLFSMNRLDMKHTRFVFLSSAGVYGNPFSLPITEDMPLNPLSPYAVHKVMCEDLCKYFVKNYGMNIKIARIFSAYGAGLKKQIFWDMHNKVNNTGKLSMFGTGNESRDYIHVDDVVQSLYLLATEDSEDTVFNIANGEEITIRLATEIFADCVGVERNKIEFNGIVREGDPINWRADVSRIKKLGYNKCIEMKDGIQDYVDWVRKQHVWQIQKFI